MIVFHLRAAVGAFPLFQGFVDHIGHKVPLALCRSPMLLFFTHNAPPDSQAVPLAG